MAEHVREAGPWRSVALELEPGRVTRVTMTCGGAAASYEEVVQAWRVHADARQVVIDALASVSYGSFFWEVVPVSRGDYHRPFEFVLVQSSTLERMVVDPEPFRERFAPGKSVVRFPNLGGDAVLVVPCPEARHEVYSHFAHFVRRAPGAQAHELFTEIGDAVDERLGDRPLWLSTAGMGVSWLHVRLDSRPKYYRYQPYKTHAV